MHSASSVRRSRAGVRFVPVLFVMAVLAGVVAAFAVPVAGFEIDGNLVATGSEVDWAPDGGTNVIDATRDADSDGNVFTPDPGDGL